MDCVTSDGEVFAYFMSSSGSVSNAEDAGSLKRARELEAIGFLQITLAAAETVPWTGGFAIAK